MLLFAGTPRNRKRAIRDEAGYRRLLPHAREPTPLPGHGLTWTPGARIRLEPRHGYL